MNKERFVRGAGTPVDHRRSIFLSRLVLVLGLLASGLDLSAQNQTDGALSNVPALVGRYGDPRTFEFVGQERFRAEEFVRGLQYSLDFQFAAGSDQPMAELISKIEESMVVGFENSGHPDATVAVSWDADREKIVVRVEEGPHFVNGDVQVTGGTTLDTDAFRVLLLSTNKVAVGQLVGFESDEDTEDFGPIWKTGNDTDFDDLSAQSNNDLITNLLALAGHPFARASHELIRNDNGTCDMRVTILDEGPQATIGKIRIENAKRNPPEKILEQLGFKSGDPYHMGLDGVIRRQLIDGGRFIDYRLTVTPPNDEGAVDLTIAVRELMTAPPLGEELSEVDQLLLKSQKWFESSDRSEVDIEVKFVDEESGRLLGRVIVSDTGFFGEYSGSEDFLRSIALVTKTNAIFAVPEIDQAVAFPVSDGVVVIFTTSASEDWDHANRFSFDFGAGLSSIKNDEAPVVLTTQMLPAAFLSFAEELPQQPKLNETNLVLEGDSLSISIDRATGRLIRAVSSREGMTMEINTGEGILDAAQESVIEESKALKNLVTSEHPLSSGIAGFIRLFFAQPAFRSALSDEIGNARDAEKLSDVLQLLDWEKVMDPFDQIRLFSEDTENNFYVPMAQYSPDSDTQPKQAVYGAWMVFLADDLFARDSGLWLFSRGMGFYLAGMGYSGLERLVDSDEMKKNPAGGPLAYWMFSRIAAETGLIDDLVRETARTSYRLLSPAQFRDEIATLLVDDSVLSRSIQQLGYAIAGDGDEDLDQIAETLGQPWSRFIRDTATEIRAKGDQPLVDVWLPVWEQLYRDGLEEMLEDDLFKLMSGSSK